MFTHVCIVLLLVLCFAIVQQVSAETPALPEVPKDYFAEPDDLPFDMQILEQKQEAGWRWTEFLYTSIVYQGEPVRVHAVYALPDVADPARKLPAIIATHGADTGTRGTAASWYWPVIAKFAKAGYATLFYDWDFKPTPDWDAKAEKPRRFTYYGKLDFRKTGYFSKGNDFKDGLHYQAMLAAKRGVSWLLAQPEVDGGNIGAFGSSYGGIFSSMLFGIDPRIKAANPEVYTSDFGLKEESYNMLPGGWTEAEAQAWRARFDSYVLLANRPGPILYTVGANDNTFLLTKATRIFAAMHEPKHMLIGPNQGHGYWDLDQSVLFFDEALKGKTPRPAVSDVQVKSAGREVIASVKVDRVEPGKGKVEFFMTHVFELDPDRGCSAVAPDAWKWTPVEASRQADGSYTARWPLPVMRPFDGRERSYYWGNDDVLNPKDPKSLIPQPIEEEKLQGAVRVFVRATGANGAMECSPLQAEVRFDDPPLELTAVIAFGNDTLPALEGAARVKAGTVIAINSTVPAGQPMATFDLPLPVKAVGTHGYALWNWRQKAPSTTLKTGEADTPTKKILSPFVDTIKEGTFKPLFWAYNANGGLTSFTIDGTPDVLANGRSYHGGIHLPGSGAMEELPIEVQDDQEHRLTLVMPACHAGACNMRVSLCSAGHIETVRYRHTADIDQVIQFRFKGKVTLRVQMTSQPAQNYMTLVGPSAIFLD
ncbi:MAG: alpha/beta hydrolase family protein [Armatimonadota bacterium]